MRQPPRRPLRHLTIALAATVVLAASFSAIRAYAPSPPEPTAASNQSTAPADHNRHRSSQAPARFVARLAFSFAREVHQRRGEAGKRQRARVQHHVIMAGILDIGAVERLQPRGPLTIRIARPALG